MAEWRKKALGDITGYISKGIPPAYTDKDSTAAICVLNQKCNKNFDISYEDSRYHDVALRKVPSEKMLRAGDVLINSTGEGTAGRVAQIFQIPVPTTIDGHMIVMRPTDEVDSVYYGYAIKNCQKKIESIAEGSTGQTEINRRRLQEEVLIKYPVDKDIQKAIGHFLFGIDEKIRNNRKINDNLQQQAASIFAEWLNTCADASTIGDMSYNILDYSPVCSEQIRLLNSSDITEGVFPIAPLVPNKDLKGHFKKRFQFGDILYSEIRPRNHHYGLVLFDASDYIASTRLMVIRAIENKVSPAMLYQYLLLPEVEAEFTLKTESRSGTFPQGNYADMASIRVPYSPTDSQVAISETLTQIRYTIAQNQLESQRLAELRDTLLPKLMSGELDVSAVEL